MNKAHNICHRRLISNKRIQPALHKQHKTKTNTSENSNRTPLQSILIHYNIHSHHRNAAHTIPPAQMIYQMSKNNTCDAVGDECYRTSVYERLEFSNLWWNSETDAGPLKEGFLLGRGSVKIQTDHRCYLNSASILNGVQWNKWTSEEKSIVMQCT